ncbi:MAG: hypothetical protein WDN04_10795 [Rhodospirillales bacterium]
MAVQHVDQAAMRDHGGMTVGGGDFPPGPRSPARKNPRPPRRRGW